MNFNKHAEAEYKKIEDELSDISEEKKRRKAEIDQELEANKSQLAAKLVGLEKYLIAAGLRDKEVRKKPKPKPEK